MNSATMTTRTLAIDGMSGDGCVQKVTGAIRSVQGVTIQSVKVGAATIGADQAGYLAACTAIGLAGFKTGESACFGSEVSPTPALANPMPERKGDGLPGTTTQHLTGGVAVAADAKVGADVAHAPGAGSPAVPVKALA